MTIGDLFNLIELAKTYSKDIGNSTIISVDSNAEEVTFFLPETHSIEARLVLSFSEDRKTMWQPR